MRGLTEARWDKVDDRTEKDQGVMRTTKMAYLLPMH